MILKKVISGGQTGADRAALDAAITCAIEHGGWCPKGRRAEDGVIPPHYNLIETASSGYPERTEKNIVESDGTLILLPLKKQGDFSALGPGTKLTMNLVLTHRKPMMSVSAYLGWPQAIARWIKEDQIKVLNVAGSRESKHPGFQQACTVLLTDVFM